MTVKETDGVDVMQFAFVGKMASGKGTYTAYFKDAVRRELGIDISTYVFSTKIVEVARELFGMERRDRKLMSHVANKMREIDRSVWANYVVNRIKEDDKRQFIIDGIRIVEEADVVKRNFPDIVIIKIEADEKERMEAYRNEYGRYPDANELSDKSEAEIDSIPFDIAVFNSYERKKIKEEIDEIVRLVKDGNAKKLRGLKIGFL